MDIDIPLPPPKFYDPEFRQNWIDAQIVEYDPLTYFFEREDGHQFLVWLWKDGTVLHAERENSSEIWSPPITGEKR